MNWGDLQEDGSTVFGMSESPPSNGKEELWEINKLFTALTTGVGKILLRKKPLYFNTFKKNRATFVEALQLAHDACKAMVNEESGEEEEFSDAD